MNTNGRFFAHEEDFEFLDDEVVKKANPFHDALGRFATQAGAKFVSLGGVFAKSNQRARDQYAKESGAQEQIKEYESELALLEGKVGLRLGSSVGDMARRLQRNSPDVSPMQLVTAIFGKDLDVVSGKLFFRGNSDTLVVFGGRGTKVHGAQVTEVQRDFDFGNRIVDHAFLKIRADQRGGGAVKEMFKDSIPLYVKMGMKTIEASANIDAGGYAWGRYGFTAARPSVYAREVAGEVDHLHSNLVVRSVRYGDLSKEAEAEFASLDRLLRSNQHDPFKPVQVSGTKTPHLDAALAKSNLVQPLPNGKNPSFVQAALNNYSWAAEFSLSSKLQIEALGKYIGATAEQLVGNDNVGKLR